MARSPPKKTLSQPALCLVSCPDCSKWHFFACFPTVECVPTIWKRPYESFLLMSLTVEEKNEREVAMNVIWVKECEESKSPTPWKFTFLLDWNFFWTTMKLQKKVTISANTFDCRKMSKKNARYYSWDYLVWYEPIFW